MFDRTLHCIIDSFKWILESKKIDLTIYVNPEGQANKIGIFTPLLFKICFLTCIS